jgi:cytochrome bd-type quinol oxidase subunit 1
VFSVHITSAGFFGISFPALILIVAWWYLRTADQTFKMPARRSSKVFAASFATGVVTGTILSFNRAALAQVHCHLR